MKLIIILIKYLSTLEIYINYFMDFILPHEAKVLFIKFKKICLITKTFIYSTQISYLNII